MNKELANNTIIMLDRVSITGHKERMIMNDICDELANDMRTNGECQVCLERNFEEVDDENPPTEE
jgi:hypothetical protein